MSDFSGFSLNSPMRPFERMLRSAAYDILSRRDGVSGWKRHREAFLASTRKSPSALSNDSDVALRRIVSHAFTTVPYYQTAWDAIGFTPPTASEQVDLSTLPLLTKDVVRKHKASLVSRSFPVEQLFASVTGGTTGTQTSFYMDAECRITRLGRQWGILQLCGYRPGVRRGLVWGVHDELPRAHSRLDPRAWFRSYASSDEPLGCAILNQQMMTEYHSRLHNFRPEVLYGYPSALCELAQFIQLQRLSRIRVPTVITTAERLTASQRSILAREFDAEVFNIYCSREHGCIAFECREHRGFHIDTESVSVEIIRDGKAVCPGDSGEITITDLQNRGMPFIRSQTGDIGTLSAKPCPCGLPQPVLMHLDGRSTATVYRADGARVAGLMLTDLFTDISSIRFAQFVQDRPGRIDVILVTTTEYTPDVETEVIQQVQKLMGEGTRINIRRVPEIERNPRSGKFQEVICRVEQSATPKITQAPALPK